MNFSDIAQNLMLLGSSIGYATFEQPFDQKPRHLVMRFEAGCTRIYRGSGASSAPEQEQVSCQGGTVVIWRLRLERNAQHEIDRLRSAVRPIGVAAS